jgi:hypothetical protein
MESPSFYAIIPANVRYDKDLKANEKLLYGEITCLTHQTGECWASNKYFSELYGVTPRAIQTWLGNLKDKGYIKIDLIYKQGTKEVEKRIIRLGGEQNFVTPHEENFMTPHEENFVDNNTSINITSINNIYSQNKDFDKDKSPDYEAVVKMYHDICKSLPKVIKLTDKRKRAIKARLKNYTLDDIKKAFEIAEQSEFLKGNNNRGWKANFDFLMTEDKMIGVLEGKYNFANGKKKSNIETNQSFGDELTRSQDDLCRMIGFNV